MAQVAQSGTIRLPATFTDAFGALTDPVDPTVDILNPSNAVVVNDAVLTRDSLGQFYYDFTTAADAPLGAWVARFTGTIDGGTVVGEEAFTVLPPGSVGVGEPWLLQLGEYKTMLGIDVTDTRKDGLFTAAIAAASRAIINFTERDFGSPLLTSTRDFEYDGSGFLDIDDCVDVTSVSLTVPHADDFILDADAWSAMPFRRGDAPVHYYIILPELAHYGVNPAMGFTRNLDIYVAEHGVVRTPQLVNVAATWGWEEVPEDVKQATFWTIRNWTSNPKGDTNLQSESIAGYSRSWINALSAMSALAIPNQARDILVSYQRQRV